MQSVAFDLSRFYRRESLIAVKRICPQIHLAVDETVGSAFINAACATFIFLLTSLDFYGAQLVFIEVVGIDAVDGERGVAVSSPTAAEIQFIVDTSDAVIA